MEFLEGVELVSWVSGTGLVLSFAYDIVMDLTK